MNLPRPTATPTREAHLVTLRAWHTSRFGATSAPGALRTLSVPLSDESRQPGDYVVAQVDAALVVVDAATGEVLPA